MLIYHEDNYRHENRLRRHTINSLGAKTERRVNAS